MEDAKQALTIHHTERRSTDSQVHRLIINNYLDSLRYHETATITPLGRFIYHPDSGYRGRASLVQLRRQGVRMERHSFHNSAQHLYRAAAEVSDSVATEETHAVEQRERHHTPWWWVVAALVLVLIIGLLARWFFH